MEVIFVLIGFSLLVALLFLGLFFWAVRDGQYDDPQTPAMRILFDRDRPEHTPRTDESEESLTQTETTTPTKD